MTGGSVAKTASGAGAEGGGSMPNPMHQFEIKRLIDLEFLGRDSFMPLFVVPAEGVTLDDALRTKIADAIRAAVSARFVPNEMIEIAEVPRTLSGKKLEVPVKKLLLGGDPDKTVNRDSMANPDSFDTFIAYAKTLNDNMKKEN